MKLSETLYLQNEFDADSVSGHGAKLTVEQSGV